MNALRNPIQWLSMAAKKMAAKKMAAKKMAAKKMAAKKMAAEADGRGRDYDKRIIWLLHNMGKVAEKQLDSIYLDSPEAAAMLEQTGIDRERAKLALVAAISAMRFIGVDPSSRDEHDRNALLVILTVLEMMIVKEPLNGPTAEGRRLREMARQASIQNDGTLVDARKYCMLIIGEVARFAERTESVQWLAERLARRDEGFSGLIDDIESLRSKLKRFSPVRRPGMAGAERILAELIVEERNALGFAVDDDEPIDEAVERIAKALRRDQAQNK